MKTALMMSARNPLFWALVAYAPLASAQTVGQLIPHKVKLEAVDYRGKRAVKITEDNEVANGEAYAVVKDAVFHNGAIEVELAGRPAGGRPRSWNSGARCTAWNDCGGPGHRRGCWSAADRRTRTDRSEDGRRFQ